MLARNEWKFFQNYDEAGQLLKRAADLPGEHSRAWRERSLMELSRRQFPQAIEAAQSSLNRAFNGTERGAAILALGRAVIEQAVDARLNAQAWNRPRLLEIVELLADFDRRQPGDLVAAHLLLTGSVTLGRGQLAWQAWKSYYHVSVLSAAPNRLIDAGRRLQKLLEDGHLTDSPGKDTEVFGSAGSLGRRRPAGFSAAIPGSDLSGSLSEPIRQRHC